MAVSEPGENHRAYQAFANEGNVEGMLSCYAEDAVFVAARGQHLKGLAQIRPVLQAMADSVPRLRPTLIDTSTFASVAQAFFSSQGTGHPAFMRHRSLR